MRQLSFLLVVSIAACGSRGKGADEASAPPDPDLNQLASAWTIENHIVTPRSYITDGDAAEWHGRTVAITTKKGTGYATPFQGNCKDASYSKRKRMFSDVATDEDLSGDSRFVPTRFGLPASLLEFKFVCSDRREDGRPTQTPILTLYQGGDRAMTCFSGVCYLLARNR
jgi:hypothetical protein